MTWCPATKDQGFDACEAPRLPERRLFRVQRRGAPRRRIKALMRVEHHVHPNEDPFGSNNVVPRDEKSKTYEESGANRTGRFFRGAVCSPIPARSYSSVSGSKIFTQLPRRRIKKHPLYTKSAVRQQAFHLQHTAVFNLLFFRSFLFSSVWPTASTARPRPT